MKNNYNEDYVFVPAGYMLREIVDDVFGDRGFRGMSNLDFTAELSKSINNITELEKLNCAVKTIISNKINDGVIKFKELENETSATDDLTKKLVDKILVCSKKYKERFLNNNIDVKIYKGGKLSTMSLAQSILSSSKSTSDTSEKSNEYNMYASELERQSVTSLFGDIPKVESVLIEMLGLCNDSIELNCDIKDLAVDLNLCGGFIGKVPLDVYRLFLVDFLKRLADIGYIKVDIKKKEEVCKISAAFLVNRLI